MYQITGLTRDFSFGFLPGTKASNPVKDGKERMSCPAPQEQGDQANMLELSPKEILPQCCIDYWIHRFFRVRGDLIITSSARQVCYLYSRASSISLGNAPITPGSRAPERARCGWQGWHPMAAGYPGGRQSKRTAPEQRSLFILCITVCSRHTLPLANVHVLERQGILP